MNFRQANAILIALAILASITGCGEPSFRERKLTLLATGFMKGNLSPYTRRYTRNRNRALGGMAHLVGRCRQILRSSLASGGATLLVDLGNHLSGSVEAYLSRGQMMVEMMNQLPYSCALVSNVEFTFGTEIFRARTNQAKFDYLSSNLSFADTVLMSRVKRELVVQRAGIKVGFLGYSPPNLKQLCAPDTVAQVSVQPDLTLILKRAAELKRGGVDWVVLLAKIPVDSPPSEVKAAISSSTVDLLLGIDYTEDGSSNDSWGNTLVSGLPSDNRGSRLKVAELTFDSSKRLVRHLFSTEVVGPESSPADPDVERVLNDFKSQVHSTFRERLGTLTRPLTKGWREESTFGDFLTDGMRLLTGAQVALINSGAIQDELPGGDVTLKDLMQALPFDNSITMIEVTGSKLIEFIAAGLKHSYTYQVSGMSYRARELEAGGAELIELLVAGKPVDPKSNYTLAITDFALSRADSITAPYRSVKGSIRELMVKMLKAKSPVDYRPEGRILFERAAKRRE